MSNGWCCIAMHGMTVHEMAETKIKSLTKHEHTWLLWAKWCMVVYSEAWIGFSCVSQFLVSESLSNWRADTFSLFWTILRSMRTLAYKVPNPFGGLLHILPAIRDHNHAIPLPISLGLLPTIQFGFLHGVDGVDHLVINHVVYRSHSKN